MHQARKRFGQNFLHDAHIVSKIVQAIQPNLDDNLVEIGPGLGALTQALLPWANRLHVIELDRDLIPGLQQLAKQNTHQLIVHQADALKFDFSQLADAKTLRIVGNLPYNISTPLLFHLLASADKIHDMHFMLQKEVVDRMAATPNTKAYGRLSVMLQYYCQIIPLFEVGSGAFKPAPKVTSAVVRLVPHRILPHICHDLSTLQIIVREAFNQRRKTLHNALKNFAIDWQKFPDLANLRPEQLSIGDFVRLANKYADVKAAYN